MKIIQGDCLEELKKLEAESVDCCVTSPPYWGLRDYGAKGQLGQEETPEAYVNKIVDVFREVRRVLKNDGTLWLNIGDSYVNPAQSGGADPSRKDRVRPVRQPKMRIPEGLKPKDLVGIPWLVAFALRADGWYLRQDIIWHKPNPMPESVKDRCTKAHEYIFLLSKSRTYYYDAEAIKTESKDPTDDRGARKNRKRFPTKEVNGIRASGVYPRANKRSVWTVNTKPYHGAHFAVYPEELITPAILAGCPKGGTVLDPFSGSGTTIAVAEKLGRKGVGIELNPEYVEIAKERIRGGKQGIPIPFYESGGTI